MATELPKPGVEVIQEFSSASPTIVQPTLVPFVTGVANEVVEVTNTDGTVNSDSLQGTYDQLPQVIAQSAFPDPRSNIAELDVDESSIRGFLLSSGSLGEMTDEGFLTSWNEARRAAFSSIEEIADAGFDLDGKSIVIAIDQPVSTNTTSDITVAFSKTAGNLTAAEVAAAINTAVGATVATVDATTATTTERVQIMSTTYGALSSVTVRSGATGNTDLFGGVAIEWRVEGSGFRAEDDSDNDTTSPWIQWFRGEYYEDAVVITWPTALTTETKAQLVDVEDVATEGKSSDITFTGGGSIDLQVGDQFYADGVQVVSGELERVESTRFRMGTINTTLSTYDSDGDLLTAVRDVVEVNTLLATTPFSPQYAWFQARNLDGTEVNTAGILTGNVTGAAAETAYVTGTADLIAPGPYLLTGLTLKVTVTEDDVVGDEQTVTFTSSYADTTLIAGAIVAAGVTGFTAVMYTSDGGTTENLRLSTLKTGNGQALTVAITGTANIILGFSAVTADADTGKDVEFAATVGSIITSGSAFPEATLATTNTLIFELSIDGSTFADTYTWTYSGSPAYTAATEIPLDLAAGTNGSWDVDPIATSKLTFTAVGDELRVDTVATGNQIGVQVDVTTSTGLPATSIAFAADESDFGFEGIATEALQFQLNDRPFTYEVVFATDSLDDAVALINDEVGFAVATAGGAGTDQLVLTSPLASAASKVEVLALSTTDANDALGFTGNLTATGTGRPERDMYVNGSGNAVVAAEILRNQVTGIPTNPGSAGLYLQYSALRLDVSPLAADPGLLSIDTTTILTSVLSPLNTSNPLGLGLFFALLNAPGTSVKGMGVDAVTAAAPEGTLAAYSRVTSFLESEEVYAMAPLTHDETVISLFSTHASAMSAATQKGERVVIANPEAPTRAVSTVVDSGLSADSTATDNQLLLDSDPTAALVAAGFNPAVPFTVADDVYVEITVSSTLRRYSVTGAVSSPVVNFDTTFATGENTDSFYTTTTLTEDLVNVDWSMKVRGAALLITGSTLPDNALISETVAAQATAYANRRMLYVFPENVTATIDGVDSSIAAYYACAGIAGMTAQQPPQQGFTNFPMTGFTGAPGSNDTFSNSELNVMAAGGAYVLVQEAAGAPITSRHQLTTDTTSVETREFSITRVVDFTAKFLRAGLRNYIGTFNITQPFLDSLSSVIAGMLAFLVESGVLVGADLNNIIQSETNPDTVLVDITLDVPFPANYIRLTLVV